MDGTRARKLGLPVDESLDQIIRDYIEDFMGKEKPEDAGI